MSLLELEHVSKRYREGQRERIVLQDVSLVIGPGEFVAVWGPRRSGRSTLLRVASGVETPDSGCVRFAGKDLAARGHSVLGEGIGYVHTLPRGREEQRVLDEVAAVLMARGADVRQAREAARSALARTGAERCVEMRISELGRGETVRVALARTLALSPSLVAIDEPTSTVEITERDEVLALLRSLTAEDVAVLATTGEADELAGAHQALTLSNGELRGQRTPELAPVIALRPG